MRHRSKLAAAALGLSVVAHAAQAVTGVSVEGGNGDGADMARVGIQWDWKRRWFEGREWHLGGYWDVAVGYWRRSAGSGWNENITEIGVTPVFRLQRNDLKGPYLEAGIGAHLLSSTALGTKRFSTRFQFGDHIGAGFRFGARAAFDLGYRFQHLSNAGIKRPNNGINFHQVRLQYHF